MNFKYAGYPEMYTYENFTRDLNNLEPYKKFIRTLIEKYECYSNDKIIKEPKKILTFNIVDYCEEDMYYDAKVLMNDKDRYIYFVYDKKILYKLDRYYGVIFKYSLNEIETISSSICVMDILQNQYGFNNRNELEIYLDDKANKEFKYACLINSDMFKNLDTEYRNNIEIAKQTIYQKPTNIYYAGEDVKNDLYIKMYCINRVMNLEDEKNGN